MTAQRLSVSTRTVDRMVAEGVLEKVFLRGSVRFREHDIDQIIEHGI
ncbi:MAG: helix-turn-helix domain-containing protein [Akkermansiaceae bacterium]|nr:helix-turn-helix domain-containing protein [Akkermansiaceae bacterium]